MIVGALLGFRLHKIVYYFWENKPNQTKDNLPFLNILVSPLFF